MLHVDIRCQRCGATLPLPIDGEVGCPLCHEKEEKLQRIADGAVRDARYAHLSAVYWRAFAATAVQHLTELQQIDCHEAGIAAKERESR